MGAACCGGGAGLGSLGCVWGGGRDYGLGLGLVAVARSWNGDWDGIWVAHAELGGRMDSDENMEKTNM